MTDIDVIFVGGGLANGLTAYCLAQRRPDLKWVLLEQGDRLGGQHTWSFHDSDVAPEDKEWVRPFISKSWPSHQVYFPKLSKLISSPYHSLRSSQFHEVIWAKLGDRCRLSTNVTHIEAKKVTLSDGRVLSADCVLDGRGWERKTPLTLGYQKFFGQTLRFERPHGCSVPLLMDARCAQTDGFRFFYLLPWSDHTLLVEETRYSDSPTLSPEEARSAIRAYCAERGWKITGVEHEESGALPIPLRGRLAQSAQLRTGMRGGLFHATTGYSFPEAVALARRFSEQKDFLELGAWLRQYSTRCWNRNRFFRLLNRMLFEAAAPQKRYQLFEQFYGLPENLITRFYSGRLKTGDTWRILSNGRATVPWTKALNCLF